MRFLLRHWKITVPVSLVGVGALAWLIFGFFAFHLVFVDDKVDEAAPVFASEGLPSSPDVRAETTERAATTTVPPTEPPATELPVTERPASARPPTTERPATTPPPATTRPPATTQAPVTTKPPEPVVRTIAAADFVSRDHPTSGRAVVLNDGSPQRFLRFEDFSTENGPDVNVYLVEPDGTGGFSDYVDLGDLKGNVGNQNYEIPVDADLQRFNTVVVWCVRFSSPFGEAALVTT